MFLGESFWSASAAADARHQEALTEYREEIETRIAFYRGIWRLCGDRVAEKIIQNTSPGSDARKFLFQNFDRSNWVSKAVRLLAQSYSTPPSRSLKPLRRGKNAVPNEILKQDEEYVAAALADAEWNLKMKEAERMTILLNSVVVQIVGDSLTGLPSLRITPLSRIYVRERPNYPNNLDACLGVAIESAPSDDGCCDAPYMFLRYLPLPDDEGRTKGWRLDLTDASGEVAETYAGGENKFGTFVPPLPCLPLTKIDAYDTTDFYLEGGDDIVEAPLDVAFRKTDMVFAQRYSAHPQFFASGMSDEETNGLRVGPGTIVNSSDASARLEILSPSINWSDLHDTIISDLVLWARTRSMPAGDFSTDSKYMSGTSRYYARLDLYEDRADNLEIFKSAERKLFAKFASFCKDWLYSGAFEVDAAPEWAKRDFTKYALETAFEKPRPPMTAAEDAKIADKSANAEPKL